MEGGEVPFSFGDGSGGARRSLREELSRESRFGSFSRGGDRNSWGRFRSTAPAPPPPRQKKGQQGVWKIPGGGGGISAEGASLSGQQRLTQRAAARPRERR